MARETRDLTDAVRDYVLREMVDEPAALARLRAETARLPEAEMQLSPEQGRFMQWLVELVGAQRVLEVGAFTGYSAACMALAAGPEGSVLTCDVNEEWTDIAARYWRELGVAERIELRLGPAVDTLEELLADGRSATFDLAFIDADKRSYPSYYELCLDLLRPGGLVCIDNVLWGGRVADPDDDSAQTEGVREVTKRVFADERVSATFVPIGDGLTLARRR